MKKELGTFLLLVLLCALVPVVERLLGQEPRFLSVTNLQNMARLIGPSTITVQAGSFGSAKYLPVRSPLCSDSLVRSRWRRFLFYWERSLAASVGLRWEKFPVGTRNRFLPPRSCSLLRKNHALYMRVNVEGRRAQKTYEGLVAVARELDRKT